MNNKSTPSNTMLSYVTVDSEQFSFTKDKFLPAVAYTLDGKIQGRMFDSFLFLPTPSFIYSAKNGGLTKSDWQRYVDKGIFADGGNLDALEQAALCTQSALGDNKKLSVVMTVFPPDVGVKEFGEVEGRMLDFANIDDMKAAVNWLVDEQIKRFAEKAYKAIELAGFYWFEESIDPSDAALTQVVRSFTDYVRKLGYFSCWIPFHGASGCDSNELFGFDKINMQGNFFPGQPGFPNNYAYSDYFGHQTAKQTFERAWDIIKPNGISFEMEFGGDVLNKKSITGFKCYMLYGVKLGIMDWHLFYYMGGSHEVPELASATDPYARSTYDQLFKFLNGTITEADIVLEPENAYTIIAKDW